MIRNLKISYIKDGDLDVTLAPVPGGMGLIEPYSLAAIFTQVVEDCFINEKLLLEILADNLHLHIDIKEKE